jgi:hypothetical protein
MTTLTMRRIRDHFVVTGPDIEPMTFKTRVEARDGCLKHYQGSPIREVGKKAAPGKGKERPIAPTAAAAGAGLRSAGGEAGRRRRTGGNNA